MCRVKAHTVDGRFEKDYIYSKWNHKERKLFSFTLVKLTQGLMVAFGDRQGEALLKPAEASSQT